MSTRRKRNTASFDQNPTKTFEQDPPWPWEQIPGKVSPTIVTIGEDGLGKAKPPQRSIVKFTFAHSRPTTLHACGGASPKRGRAPVP